MDSISQSLNEAHRYQRRADTLVRIYKYDEAIECHQIAAKHLADAMNRTTSLVAQESINLQREYHLTQTKLIESKKDQFARVRQAVDYIKQFYKDSSFIHVQNSECMRLQIGLYQTLKDSEELLEMLSKPNLAGTPEIVDNINLKPAKSKEAIIEELQLLNSNFHPLIESLLMQTEIVKDDNSMLKNRIQYLETERVKYLNLPSIINNLEEDRNLKVFSDGNLEEDRSFPSENTFKFQPSKNRPTKQPSGSATQLSLNKPIKLSSNNASQPSSVRPTKP